MPTVDEMFGVGGGLKDNFSGIVTSAEFSRPPQYNEGKTTCLVLTIKPDDGTPDVTQLYPCGPDWVSWDSGKTASHPDNDRTTFNGSTRIMKLCRAALDVGARDILAERQAAAGGLGPRHSQIWNGLNFHWKRVSESFTPQGETQARTTNTLYPDEYLGTADLSNLGASETVTLSGGGHSVAVSPELATKINVLAKTKSYSDFVDAVMDIPGALATDGLAAALTSEEFYTGLAVS